MIVGAAILILKPIFIMRIAVVGAIHELPLRSFML